MGRHLEQLDEASSTTVLAMIDSARAQAVATAREVISPEIITTAEQQHPVPQTGHHLARITGAAGSIAAHAIRLSYEPTCWPGDVLESVRAADSSWDWDERMQAALDLRRALSTRTDDEDSRHIRLTAAWLTHTDDAGLIPASVRLCDVATADAAPLLGAGWWAVFGTSVLSQLVERGPRLTLGRRPSVEEVAQRAALRAAVEGIKSARVMGRSATARAAGITLKTYDNWTSEAR